MFGLLKHLTKRASRWDDYVLGAVKAYVLKGDEAAGLMAFLATSEAPNSKTAEVISFLAKASGEVQSNPSVLDDIRSWPVVVARLDTLSSRMAAGRWGRLSATSVKRQLRMLGRSYYDAHGRMDPKIFYTRYPDLRDADTLDTHQHSAKERVSGDAG